MAEAVKEPRRVAQFSPTAVRVLDSIGLVVVLVLLWQLVTSSFDMVYFPTPVRILHALISNWFTAQGFSEDILPSLVRLTLGWLAAVAAGVPLGLAIGQSRSVADYVKPLIHYARSVPPPVVLPVFMIFFGVGSVMKVVFIAFGVLWPILLNTVRGVESIDRTQLETAAVLRIPARQRLQHVVVPAALPDIMAGLRISLSMAFILMVISEMIAASGGVGFQILQSQAEFDVVDMWAGIVILALGGVVFNAALSLVEARILHWHRAQRREAF
jgi:ABC-type nitrate/sulfonate/bicarbonate transport system permease component